MFSIAFDFKSYDLNVNHFLLILSQIHMICIYDNILKGLNVSND
jgi:hypothetical protein